MADEWWRNDTVPSDNASAEDQEGYVHWWDRGVAEDSNEEEEPPVVSQ